MRHPLWDAPSEICLGKTKSAIPSGLSCTGLRLLAHTCAGLRLHSFSRVHKVSSLEHGKHLGFCVDIPCLKNKQAV